MMGPAVLKKRSMRVPLRHAPEEKTILLDRDRSHAGSQTDQITPIAVIFRHFFP
jgi:hypothetical protein